MKILAIETSSMIASVAVATKDAILAECTMNNKKTHSQTLLPMIDKVCDMLEMNIAQMDAIAVAGGPGSYTGLRIGSATAKGIGLALNIPIINVPTIDAMAYNYAGSNKVICPMLDAKRAQVFTGVYTFLDGKLNVIKEQMAADIKDVIKMLNEIGKEVIFLGDGIMPNIDYIKNNISCQYTFAPLHLNGQKASCVAALALEYYNTGKFENAREHLPNYLKLSQAERELAEKKGNNL